MDRSAQRSSSQMRLARRHREPNRRRGGITPHAAGFYANGARSRRVDDVASGGERLGTPGYERGLGQLGADPEATRFGTWSTDDRVLPKPRRERRTLQAIDLEGGN